MNKQLLKTYFLIAFVALAVIGYAQQKQNAKPEATKAPATAELKNEKATESQSEAYTADKGRTISAELAKQYMKAYPGYEKLCTPNDDKKSYTDKNDLLLIMQLQEKHKIKDENLAAILKEPKNQKMIAELREKMNAKKEPEAKMAEPAKAASLDVIKNN